MVACLTLDQKVACLNHVGFIQYSICTFDIQAEFELEPLIVIQAEFELEPLIVIQAEFELEPLIVK